MATAGYRVARPRANRAAGERDLLVLPSARRPRLLVPSERRASAAAVRRYGEPGSLAAWAGSRTLALALRAGAAHVGLGGRLRISAGPGTDTIEAYLGGVLGREVLVSTHLGAARANRKPVLQLLTPDGVTAGFAKVSVNPLTRDLIRAERAALDALAPVRLRHLVIPRVLHHGQWRGREVLVLTALPVWRRRTPLRPARLAAAMAELAAVGGRARARLAASVFLARLAARLGGTPGGPDRDALVTALGKLAAADPELGFGAWHGDWTGWNMASTPDGLLVWDWERFTRPVPVGFDALHYGLQTAVVRRGQPAPAAAAACVQHRARRAGPVRRAARRGGTDRRAVPGRAVGPLPGRPAGRGRRPARPARRLADPSP